MSILTSLYDNLSKNQRVIDLGFGVLGGVISIVGTRALGIGVDKDDDYEDFESEELEDD